MPPFDATLVIPCFRRPDLLRRAFSALERQTHPHDRFEVICVDDSGPEAYGPQRELCRETASRVDFRLRYFTTGLPADVYGVTVARNIGARMGEGLLTVNVDDNCVCHPTMIEQHVRAHQSNNRLVTVGYRSETADVLDQPLPIRVVREKCRREVEKSSRGELGAGDFKNENCAVRRVHLESIGWFDERFAQRGEHGYTDRECGMRLLAQGLEFRALPDAAVWSAPDAVADGPEAAARAERRAAAQERAHERFKRAQRVFWNAQWKSRVLGVAGLGAPLFPWPGTTPHSDPIVARLRAGAPE